MKLLLLLPYSPIPTNTGNKNLTFNLLKYLEKKYSVDIIIFENLNKKEVNFSKIIKRAYPNIKNIYIFERNKGLNLYFYKIYFLLQGLHPALGNYYSFKVAKWINLNSNMYDLVHFDMFLVSPYINSIKNKPTLLVSSDAYTLAATLAMKNLNNFFEKININFQKILLANLESLFYKKFTKIVCVSNIDKDYLTSKLKLKNIISIGIPIAEKLRKREINHHNKILGKNSEIKLLITGSLNHNVIAKNITSFIKNVVPNILNKHKNLEIFILGKSPTDFLQKEIDKNINIKHIEFVEDYFEFLDNDWIYIYPQKCATGLQTKLQQALASGLPVLAYEVSCGGLYLTHKKNAFIIKEEKDFFNYIDKLIENPKLRKKIGKAALEHIQLNYSINKIGKKYTGVYEKIIKKANP